MPNTMSAGFTPMSPDLDATQAVQRAFARHLRDPAVHPAPDGLPERRLQVYRDLFFNTVEGLLATQFPVTRELLGDAAWRTLVRDFYRDHAARTPLFTEVGREFLQYLDGRDAAHDAPFLRELAHYEWVELALAIDERDHSSIDHDADGDVVAQVPVLSPLAWCFRYRWPVHRLRPDFVPDAAPEHDTVLVIVRNRRDELSFLALQPLAAVLFDVLKEDSGATGLELAQALADALPAIPRDAVIEGACASLREFRARDILLGTVPGA